MLMFYLSGWGGDHALETENTLRRKLFPPELDCMWDIELSLFYGNFNRSIGTGVKEGGSGDEGEDW